MDELTTEATLAITSGSDPISGSLTHSDGTIAPFRGWLELASIIEELRAQTHAPLPTAPPTA
jgi:hypothetical protein